MDDEEVRQIVANIEAFEASLSPIELYRHRRARLVRTARNWRRFERSAPDMATEFIRSTQIIMVKLRYWHRTGEEPGDA